MNHSYEFSQMNLVYLGNCNDSSAYFLTLPNDHTRQHSVMGSTGTHSNISLNIHAHIDLYSFRHLTRTLEEITEKWKRQINLKIDQQI